MKINTYMLFAALAYSGFVQAESTTLPTARHLASAIKQKHHNTPFNAWSALATYTRNDRHVDSLSKTHGQMASVGVDSDLLGKYRMGISYSYTNDKISTLYNSGNIKCNSNTLAPYFVMPLADNTTAMFLVGHGWIQSKINMLDSGVYAAGSQKTKTDFAGTYVTYAKKTGKLSPSIRGGYVYYNAKSGNYTLSNGRLVGESSTYRGLASTSVRCGYKTSENAEPYAEGGLEWEIQRPKNTQPKAQTGWYFGGGVSLRNDNSPWKFQAGYTRTRSTVKVDEHRFMLRINTKF